MEKTKHLFIVNPNAGKGIASILAKKIRRLFEKIEEDFGRLEYEIVESQYPGHAIKLARDYSKKEKLRVYAVGGDGTLNEVMCGLVGSDSSLACIPGGSDNDFIRTIKSDYEIDDLLMNTILGDEKKIDIGRINDRYFINILSFGFDATVNASATKYKKNRFVGSAASYILAVIENFRNLGPKSVVIESMGKKVKEKLFLMAICNGTTYGGGFKVSPNSKLDDGNLNTIYVRNINFKKLLFYVNKLRNGKHLELEEIEERLEKKLKVTSEEELLYSVDGEIYRTREAEIEIIPNGINFVFPRS